MASELLQLSDINQAELIPQQLKDLTQRICEATNRTTLLRSFQKLRELSEEGIHATNEIPDEEYYNHLQSKTKTAKSVTIIDVPSVCIYTALSFLFAMDFYTAKVCCKRWHGILSQPLAMSILRTPIIGKIEEENRIYIDSARWMKFSLYFESANLNERKTVSWYHSDLNNQDIYWTSSDLKQPAQSIGDAEFHFLVDFFTLNIYQFNDTIHFASRDRDRLGDYLLVQREIKPENPKYRVSEIHFKMQMPYFDLTKEIVPTEDGSGFLFIVRLYRRDELHRYYTYSSDPMVPLSQKCNHTKATQFSIIDQMKLKGDGRFRGTLFLNSSKSEDSEENPFYIYFAMDDPYKTSIQVCRQMWSDSKQTLQNLFSIQIDEQENIKEVFVRALRTIPIICVISTLRWRFYTIQGFWKEFKPLYTRKIYDVTLGNDNGNIMLFILVIDGIIKYRITC